MTDLPCEVVIIRHGQTLWNEQEILQGQADSPLTALGRQQAKCLGDRLASESFGAIYSSDLGRAMETAAVVAQRLKMKVLPDSDLRERNATCFQGLTWAQVEEKFPDLYKQYWEDPSFAPPGGETAAQVHDRAIRCIDRLVVRHAGEKILIVTHGHIMMNVFKHTVGLHHQAHRRFALDNATINRFRIQADEWQLVTWGQPALSLNQLQKSEVL
ncbi:MAG: histidine phosphatase family protein [Phycisphaerae bacterium]|nr:histidine phosphatase family protein [Phycisphaerae bacterium]